LTARVRATDHGQRDGNPPADDEERGYGSGEDGPPLTADGPAMTARAAVIAARIGWADVRLP
jgi:hypothetical protein